MSCHCLKLISFSFVWKWHPDLSLLPCYGALLSNLDVAWHWIAWFSDGPGRSCHALPRERVLDTSNLDRLKIRLDIEVPTVTCRRNHRTFIFLMGVGVGVGEMTSFWARTFSRFKLCNFLRFLFSAFFFPADFFFVCLFVLFLVMTNALRPQEI